MNKLSRFTPAENGFVAIVERGSLADILIRLAVQHLQQRRDIAVAEGEGGVLRIAAGDCGTWSGMIMYW